MSVFFLDFLGTRQSDVQRYQKTVLSFLEGEMSKIVPSISLHFHLGNNTYMCGLPTLKNLIQLWPNLIWAWSRIKIWYEAQSRLGLAPNLSWAPALISFGPGAWFHFGLGPDLILAPSLISLGPWAQSHLGVVLNFTWVQGPILLGPGVLFGPRGYLILA